jgi:hypothetical protein
MRHKHATNLIVYPWSWLFYGIIEIRESYKLPWKARGVAKAAISTLMNYYEGLQLGEHKYFFYNSKKFHRARTRTHTPQMPDDTRTTVYGEGRRAVSLVLHITLIFYHRWTTTALHLSTFHSFHVSFHWPRSFCWALLRRTLSRPTARRKPTVDATSHQFSAKWSDNCVRKAWLYMPRTIWDLRNWIYIFNGPCKKQCTRDGVVTSYVENTLCQVRSTMENEQTDENTLLKTYRRRSWNWSFSVRFCRQTAWTCFIHEW